MSYKVFCDWCGEETARNYVTKRICGLGYIDGNNPALVEIVVGTPRRDTNRAGLNVGDICKSCLKKVVNDAIDSEVMQ